MPPVNKPVQQGKPMAPTQQGKPVQQKQPEVVAKNPALARLGPVFAEGVVKHAEDTTIAVAGFVNLPPGITNGIAQLTEMYFGVYKTGEDKGETFCRMAGNVYEPLTAMMVKSGKMSTETMRTRGKTTSLMFGPIKDTVIKSGKNAGQVKTVQDFADEIMRHMRALGGDTSGVSCLDDLESIAETLVAEAPYFEFVTEPRIAQADNLQKGVKKGDITGAWEKWGKRIEDYEPAPVQKVGVDNTGQVATPPPSQNGTTPPNGKAATPPTQKVQPHPVQAPIEQVQPHEEQAPFVVETCEDLDLLLQYADSDHDLGPDAQNRIIELGVAAGGNQNALQSAPTWAGTVEMVNALLAGGGNDETAVKVGDPVGYFPKNPTTKKKEKNPVKAFVEAVNDDGTVNLKVGKAKFKNIELTELVDAPTD